MSEIKKINGKTIKDESARNDIEEIKQSYAEKEYVDTAIERVDVTDQLVDYAKKTELPTKVSQLENDENYLTEHQDISHLAEKIEIPTKTSQLTNDNNFLTEVPDDYATEKYVDDSIANVPIYDDTELRNLIDGKANTDHEHNQYLTEHQSLEGYATEQYVDENIGELNGKIYYGELSDFLDTSSATTTVRGNLDVTQLTPNVSYYLYDDISDGVYATTGVALYNGGTKFTSNAIMRLRTYAPMINMGVKNNLLFISNGIDCYTINLETYEKTVTSYGVDNKINKADVLSKTNSTEYTPTSDYHPATKKYVDDSIADVDVTTQLGEYAKKSEIPTKVSDLENDSEFLTEIPSEYITETELNNKGYLTQHQDLSTYAKKSEIPTVTNDLTNALKSNYDSAYTHSTSSHAPSNAQKNSDITKAEVEAKLTGNITSHTHSQYLTEHQSLSDYAKKTEIPTVPTNVSAFNNDKGYITSIPSEYVTETELNNKGYLTQHQSLTDYAKKTDVPTKVSQLTNDKNYLTSIPSEYVTDTELTAKGYLTQHQDLSAYAKTSQIPTKVSQLENDKGYLTEHQSLEGYATEDYVTTEIAKAKLEGEDVDLSGYATKDDLHNHSNKSVLDGITSSKVTEWNNKSTFDGNYNNLTNKPTIPTVSNDLTDVLKSNYDKAYTHSQSTHAPTNAQKNSDITKTEIEAKLTGTITSHSHNYLTSNDMITRDRLHTSLIPSGTSIPPNTDLNTIDYIKVGSYFCNKNVDAKTLLNCPTEVAFMMEVSSPLSTSYDNETTNAWVYRLRTITVHNTGDKYIQYVSSGSTAGEFTYKDWQKVAFTKEIPTSTSQLTNDSGYTTTNAMNLALNNKVDKVDGKGLSTNDYTTTEKNKLAGIENGATKTTVYTASQCTTFTSDEGTCTPLAVQKAVGMFPPKAHQHTEYATQNDVANAKAENPYRKISHKANATSTWYYPLISFVKDNGSNYGNFNISGRMGGWESWKVANYDILLVNRSGSFDGLTITSTVSASGEVATALQTVDIEVFVQDDTSAIAYLKVNGYFLFDFSVMENQHTCIFDGTYLTEQPTGNLRWRLSDANKTILYADGRLSQTGYPNENEHHDLVTMGYLIDHKPHPGNYFVNGFAGMTGDGVMEVGKYQDWHNTNDDANDFSVRIMCDSSNQNTVKLPQTSGRLALEENIPTTTSQLTNDAGFTTSTDVSNTLGNYYTKSQAQSNFYSWDSGKLDIDKQYNGYLSLMQNGTNSPSGQGYGVALNLPYRKFTGNSKPDYMAQMFFPNGDDPTQPDSMFYRTSDSDSWRKWNEVETKQTKTFTLPATAGWYRIAEAEVGNVCGRIRIEAENGNYACSSILDAVITKNKYPSLIPIAHSIYSSNSLSITQARIVYVSGSSTEKSYLEVYVSCAVALNVSVTSESNDWQLIDPIASETSPSGYGLFSCSLSYNINGYAKHDHTHHKVTAMSFNSNGNLSITIDGVTKEFKPV